MRTATTGVDTGGARRAAVVVVAIALSGAPMAGVEAQGTGTVNASSTGIESAPAAATPGWLGYWSPLRSPADAVRAYPGSGVVLPDVLATPGPRVGLFWSAGNPAALPFEVDGAWAVFEAVSAGVSGEYRRPLDPGEVESGGLRSVGWRRVGERGAVIGRVSVDRVTLGGGAPTNRLDSYGATPFAIVDTAGAELGRTAAVLEGAGGIRLGPIGLGLALAFAPAETRTVAAPVPKVNVAARPAVNAGAVWEAGPALRVGLLGRWQRTTQRIQQLAIAAGSRIYEIAGFHEPIPLDLASHYNRRIEAEALGAGVAVGGEALGGGWVLHAETGEVEEVQWDGSTTSQSRDRWTATRLEAGLAVQRPFPYGQATVIVTGRVLWSGLDGTAVPAERPDAVFDVTAETVALHADVRLTHPSGWRGAVTLGTVRSTETRRDALERIHAEIRSWSPTVAVEVARELGAGFSLAAGGAAGQYAPAGGVPDPATLGEVYRMYLAPELMLRANPATVLAGAGTLRWTGAAGSGVWLRARYGALRRSDSYVRLPLTPEGERTGWGVSLGVTLSGAGRAGDG